MNQEDNVKQELAKLSDAENELFELQSILQKDSKFRKFIEAQQKLDELQREVWGRVEQAMIDNDITQIKTDDMTISLATRTSFDVDLDLLPKKYTKTVADTTFIGKAYKLEGKAPKGCTPKQTKYLVKRIKK